MANGLFLKIDGIDDDSTDPNHRNAIDLVAYSWSESQSGSISSPVGVAAGRVRMQEFVVLFRACRASPLLFVACAEGRVLTRAVLSVARAATAGGFETYLAWTFDEVVVTGYATDVGYLNNLRPADGVSAPEIQVPLEQVRLSFARIELSFRPVSGSPVVGGWDLTQNTRR